MNNLTINKNEILFSRKGELVRITPCGNNAIRFQAFPDCSVINENYILMPQKADAVIEEPEHSVSVLCGKLKAVLERNGKVTFFYNDKKSLN